MAADGVANTAIAASLSVSPASVKSWRDRFAEEGLAKLGQVRKGRGREPSIPQSKIDEIIDLTQNYRPKGETHWSCRTMAAAAGVSKSTVQLVWHARGLKPHRVKTFKLSNDPRFEEKLVDVVGLYMDPPEKAIVLCADEKSSVQALDRTQASLPMVKGRGETMTHDYKRHGTTTLFAALDVLTGTVIGQCMPRHRHQEWLKFLKTIDREDDQGPGDPPHRGQLRHPQTPRRHRVARHPSSVPPALHPDVLLLVESGGTVAPRADRKALRRSAFHFMLDRIASIQDTWTYTTTTRGPAYGQRPPNPSSQSGAWTHRPRKSQLNPGHTTSLPIARPEIDRAVGCLGRELLLLLEAGESKATPGLVADLDVDVMRTDEFTYERFRRSVDLDFDYLSTPTADLNVDNR